ncbi:MAG: hypothetical protein IJT41_13415 [Clostridia bacterium]|nr:hypothetical protein [Clostridia bacterium]
MDRQIPRRPQRDARFSDVYRDESRRMHDTPQVHTPPCAPQSEPPAQNRDEAVILPLLLLLMREKADRYLMLALLYILLADG